MKNYGVFTILYPSDLLQDPITDLINRLVVLITNWWIAIQGLGLVLLTAVSGIGIFVIAAIALIVAIKKRRQGISNVEILEDLGGLFVFGILLLGLATLGVVLLAQRGNLTTMINDLVSAILGGQ